MRKYATPLLLLALVALLFAGAVWGWRNLTAPIPEPEPTPCVQSNPDVVATRDVAVRVYNGGGQAGAANGERQRLSDAGFRVVLTTNADFTTKQTLIRANKNSTPQLRLVASYYKNATVEHDDRIDGTVDVIIGSEQVIEGEAPLSQVSPGKEGACLPPDPSASPTPTA